MFTKYSETFLSKESRYSLKEVKIHKETETGNSNSL